MKIARPEANQTRPQHAVKAFEGVLFNVWHWQQEFPNGKTRTFESLQRPDTVLILPCNDKREVILGKEQQPQMKPMLRSLGGRLEEGESVIEGAQRELLEETGYRAENWELWAAWQPINKIDWAVYLLVAKNLIKVSAQELEDGEDIRLFNIGIDEFLDGNSNIQFDDYELMYQLNFARSNNEEQKRVRGLFKDD